MANAACLCLACGWGGGGGGGGAGSRREQESEVEDRRVMVGREARKRGREGLSHDCNHTNKSGTIMLLFVVVGGRAQRYSAAVFLN